MPYLARPGCGARQLKERILLGGCLTLMIAACDSTPTPTEPGSGSPELVAAAVSYRAVDLGALPGQRAGGSATDVNDTRQVVGTTAFGTEYSRGFLWRNGVMTNLGTLGGSWSTAAAINNAGTVTGTSARSDGKLRAFRWTNGTMRGLGTLGGSRSEGTGINTMAHIVGWSYLTGDPRQDPELEPITHAFLWRNGNMIDLGTLGGANSRAYAINDAGEVVGQSETGGGATHAFLWKNGVMTDLGGTDRSTYFLWAMGINQGGKVVGIGTDHSRTTSFLWWRGVLTNLGTFGGTAALARDINGASRLVGGVDPPGSLRRAFTHKDGVTTLLPMLPGGRTNEAFAINKNGDIAGWSEGRALRTNGPTLWLKQ